VREIDFCVIDDFSVAKLRKVSGLWK